MDRTAILVRWPASRAIAAISTEPSAISGTSSAKSFFTRLGWVRDRVTDGPRTPLATRTTYVRSRSAVRVVLAGHLLLHRQDRLQLADVDQDVLGVLALLDDAGDDVALAARVLAEGDLVLGVPQPLQDDLLGGGRGDPAEAGRGVVELAWAPAPSSRSSGSSLAHTVTWPVLRSSSTRARRRLPSVRWYAMRRADSIASTSRSKEISFSRTRPRRALMSMSTATPPPCSRRVSSALSAPCG